MENKDLDLDLLKSIKDNLLEEDQEVASYLDFNKTNDEIIIAMKEAKLINLNIKKTYDQKI